MEIKLQLYQILVVGVSLYMIVQGIIRFAKHESGQSFLKLLARLVVWGGMSAVALFPQITTIAANFIGLKGNINAVILTGFLLVFLMMFKLLSAIERLEQQISEVTRKEALKDVKKSPNDSDSSKK